MSKATPVTEAERRVAELEHAAEAAAAELTAARAALGEAVATGNEHLAAGLRERVAAASARADEATLALPVARRRLESVREAVAAEQREVARRRVEELSREYVALAERVDSELAALAAAHDELARLRTELYGAAHAAGNPLVAGLLSRRAGAALAWALWHASPALALDLGLPRRGVRALEQPLAAQVARLLRGEDGAAGSSEGEAA